ncbi:MAG: MerR family transcriptional regulator [Streptosporangiaceae bacterium]|jgi:MerR family copper efflux transcriptional regulator
MRISEAARRLGMSPRMLRYREDLRLLPVLRGADRARVGHRQFTEADLEAIRFVMSVERRFDVSPAAVSFALRALSEPSVRAAVTEAGRRIGRLPVSAPVQALDFEKERALRALRPGQPGNGSLRSGRNASGKEPTRR